MNTVVCIFCELRHTVYSVTTTVELD